jgi:hypothetical protein
MTKCMQCYCMAVSLSVSADKPQKRVTKSVVLSLPGIMAPYKITPILHTTSPKLSQFVDPNIFKLLS